MSRKKIKKIDQANKYVTRPSLPPAEEFSRLMEEIWKNGQLTNNGPFLQEFEQALAQYLEVKHVSVVANGTLGLMIALKALDISGEVITTPYSFAATAHALKWSGLKPVFTDIDPVTCNLDPDKVENAITPVTSAILPVHVYGTPCRVDRIEAIARQHGLKVIYDACHTFDVRLNGIPVVNFGDLSVMSFHATKVFTTFEGGAIISCDREMKRKVDLLRNFGFENETTVSDIGINAKMNELQAAMGLLQLKYVSGFIDRRRKLDARYREMFKNISGIRVLEEFPGVKQCHPYFPIFIDQNTYGRSRDELYEFLKAHKIYSRRYFYPLISQFPPYNRLESSRPGSLPEAERISSQVICLPLYTDLTENDQDLIVKLIRK